jgi:hypothetical protein
MSTAIRLVEHDNVGACCGSGVQEETGLGFAEGEARWTTKQVIIACLWSALFGVGCGYAWVLLQLGTVRSWLNLCL